MNYIFWICWAVEMLAVFFWLASEMRLKYLSPNPFSFISALYLCVVLALRFTNQPAVALMMVIIPAIPLVMMFFLFTLHTVFGSKWI